MSKLKSVVLTTGIFPPDIGGPASFIPVLAERFVKKGIKVTVITLTDEIQDDSLLPYKVIRISRKIKKPFRDFFVIKEIVKSAYKSDLIFSNTLAFESAIASIITRKKLIQKIVGDIAWEKADNNGRFQDGLEKYQNAHLDFISRLTNIYRNFGVFQSNLIITPSLYFKEIVNKWKYPKDKIKVIYNAVEFEKAEILHEKKKFRIISVARLIPLKSLDTVIKVLAKLDFEYEYIIIGDGFIKDSLIELSNKLNVNVNFLGSMSKKEVANWLASSDIFIQNSSHETMPHVVLEAMENGCSVIASKVGGTPEIVNDMKNGLLFEHNNEDMLLDKINLLKNTQDLREKIILEGKEFTREFADIDKMIDQYIDTIEEIL